MIEYIDFISDMYLFIKHVKRVNMIILYSSLQKSYLIKFYRSYLNHFKYHDITKHEPFELDKIGSKSYILMITCI